MNFLRLTFTVLIGAAAAHAQAAAGYDLTNRGNAAAARGDYAEAEKLHQQALEIWRAEGPGHDAFQAASLTNLGEAYCGEGKWAEGAAAFEQSLTLNRRSLGPTHTRTLANLNALGHAYLALREYPRAEAAYAEALPVEREALPHSTQLAQTLAGLAALRSRAGRLEEALPLAEQALTIGQEAEGEQSLVVAGMLANVAQIHESAGRPARAIPLFRRARAIYEHSVGPDNPLIGSLMSAEGLAYLGDGDLGMAEQDMERAVRLLAPWPAYRLMLAVAESNLGLLRIRQRRYVQADELLSKALALEEAHVPRAVGDMAVTMGILADLREKQKRPADAASLKERADAMRLLQ